ncbi:aldo/keto reductase [Nitrospinae bacterium AH-259-F20]|nr:aldo/keto reductase [Nitrospinae bacterium AH-259-F20]
MRMRFLGNTGLKVSELSLGAVPASALVRMAVDAGVNFFDTADMYSQGLAEEMLGKVLGPRRSEFIIATKVWGRMGPGPNDVGLSRHHIMRACEASLKRLRTDYIDLYQAHSLDPPTRLEDTLRAFDDLVRQGKVRYIGCSNFTGWQLMKALAISDKYGWERFVTLQAYYSLVGRDLEHELVPLCLDQGLGILPWSPLADGFLTGKYRPGQPSPEGARRSTPEGRNIPIDEERGFEIVEELDRIANDHDATVAQAALNYLLRKPGVTSVIIGARTAEQLAENLKTADWEMTPDGVSRLDAISQPPKVYPYWFLEKISHDR